MKNLYPWPRNVALPDKDIEPGLMGTDQLYDLQHDIGERHNLADSLPDLVKSMKEKLNRIVEKKVTRPDIFPVTP